MTPSLVSFLRTLISWTLTISGFFIATAAVILVLYLEGYRRLLSQKELVPYIVVVLVTAAVPLFLSAVTTLMVLLSALPFEDKTLIAIYSATPIIPSLVFLFLLLWKRA